MTRLKLNDWEVKVKDQLARSFYSKNSPTDKHIALSDHRRRDPTRRSERR